jgi:hypothetical protein
MSVIIKAGVTGNKKAKFSSKHLINAIQSFLRIHFAFQQTFDRSMACLNSLCSCGAEMQQATGVHANLHLSVYKAPEYFIYISTQFLVSFPFKGGLLYL